MTVGAALVPIQTFLSGRLAIPVTHFLGVMVAVHLIIGAIEGAITFAVIAYLRQVRPSSVGLSAPSGGEKLGRTAVVISLLGTALLLGGLISWFASTHPDGLEWSYLEHKYGRAEQVVKPASGAMAVVDDLHGKYAPMPDYSVRSGPAEEEEEPAEGAWPNVSGWGSLAGLIGTAVTLLVVYLIAVMLRKRKPAPEAQG